MNLDGPVLCKDISVVFFFPLLSLSQVSSWSEWMLCLKCLMTLPYL